MAKQIEMKETEKLVDGRNADEDEELGNCETCNEPLDQCCTGGSRCPSCDGPCLNCSDGPGPHG
jgi:hypothetical protein